MQGRDRVAAVAEAMVESPRPKPGDHAEPELFQRMAAAAEAVGGPVSRTTRAKALATFNDPAVQSGIAALSADDREAVFDWMLYFGSQDDTGRKRLEKRIGQRPLEFLPTLIERFPDQVRHGRTFRKIRATMVAEAKQRAKRREREPDPYELTPCGAWRDLAAELDIEAPGCDWRRLSRRDRERIHRRHNSEPDLEPQMAKAA